MASPEEWRTIGVLSKSKGVDAVERQWGKDMPAYARIRKEGLQPKNIDGCAELEARAHDRLEVEMGHVFETRKDLEKAQQGMRMAEDMNFGFDPFGAAAPRDGAT